MRQYSPGAYIWGLSTHRGERQNNHDRNGDEPSSRRPGGLMSACSNRCRIVGCSPAHPVGERPHPVHDILLIDNEQHHEGNDGACNHKSDCTEAWLEVGIDACWRVYILNSFRSLYVSGLKRDRMNPPFFFLVGERASASEGVGLGVRVRFRTSTLTSFCLLRSASSVTA